MGSLPPPGHLHRHHGLDGQLVGDLAADLVAGLILEGPRAGQRVESHPDHTISPRQADPIRPVVDRQLALAVDSPGHPVGRHQVPDPGQLPGSGLARRVVRPARVAQPGMRLQPGSASHRRISLALPAVHDFEPSRQLLGRPARRRLGPPLADPLRSLDHAVGLGAARRVGRDRDAQPGQPADQVGGQVAARPPGGAVVDSQPLGQPPPAEEPPQRRLGLAWVDLGPTSQGGKRPSPGRPRSPRRRPATNWPGPRRPGRSARRRRPARSDGAGWPGPRKSRADAPMGPTPARPGGTSGASSGGGARRPRGEPQPTPRGSARPPIRDGRDASPGRRGGPHRGWRGPARPVLDSGPSSPPRRGRGAASADGGRSAVISRRRRPGRACLRPAELARGVSVAPGPGWDEASKGPPGGDGQVDHCPPISPRKPPCGKTSCPD